MDARGVRIDARGNTSERAELQASAAEGKGSTAKPACQKGEREKERKRERRPASAPEREVASNKVLFVVSSARGRTLPSGAALGSLGSVLGASGTSWGGFWGASGTPWGGFWELRRRLGRLLGLLGPLGTPLGASGAPQGGSWVLPEHLREALGSSRDALGSVLGCFWDVLGSLLGLRESVGSGKDAKVEIIVLPKEFIGF